MHDGILNKHEMLEKAVELLETMNVSGHENISKLSAAFQILFVLQKGLKEEDEAKNTIIESLKEQLKRANEAHPDPGGDIIGGEQYNFNFSVKDGADNGAN